jgi:hypothetical protein
MLQNFRSFQLSVDFFHLCQSVKVASFLRDQLDRASSSISLGSLRECQAILILSNLKSSPIYSNADHLGACIYKLINKKLN